MSMAELFAKDPLKMTDEDIDQIIEEMRSRRKAFIAQPGTTKAKRSATGKQAAAMKVAGDFEI